jgi:hypothetical protein
LVSEKTGLSDERAKVAIDTVIGFLKDRLPAPVAGQTDAILGGGGRMDLGGIAGSLASMIGNK